MEPVNGIHHVTAIASDAQGTVDFYTRVLGLRFVKKTVNFDDPNVYHLYFGDTTGRPGTVLTFFNWQLPDGEKGTPSIDTVAFGIPADSVAYWEKRLAEQDVEFESDTRFDEPVLSFSDNSAMGVELIGRERLLETRPWEQSAVPTAHAIRGIAGVTLFEENLDPTGKFLENVLQFKPHMKTDSGIRRFESGHSFVDVKISPEAATARQGNGSIHHTAFRVNDASHQLEWRTRLVAHHAQVTPVVERFYFKSIYFHEPGGTLFEIATDPPGFLIDQTEEQLGKTLTLPPWFEAHRAQIEAHLAPLDTESTAAKPRLGFVHRFEPARNADNVIFIALHGTGGDESDLVGLCREIRPTAAIISPRGRVKEGPHNRFFRRTAQNVFDLADLEIQTRALAGFVSDAVTHYALSDKKRVAIGYSNGANMAVNVMLQYPTAFDGAILLRPLLPDEPAHTPDLSGKKILVLGGNDDSMIPPDRTRRLVEYLERTGCALETDWLDADHRLTPEDIATAKDWMKRYFG
jgi:predicted esterase